jgi:hypothetical protein
VLVALAVALMVLLTVLIIDESIYYISPFWFCPEYPTSILGINYR